MSAIPDFTETERWAIQSTVDERWRNGATRLREADVEVRLNPADTGLTSCPAMYCRVEHWNFVVFKSADHRYRCRFFSSRDLEQTGTGIDEYDDIADCVVTLLRTQADCARSRNQGIPAAAASPTPTRF